MNLPIPNQKTVKLEEKNTNKKPIKNFKKLDVHGYTNPTQNKVNISFEKEAEMHSYIIENEGMQFYPSIKTNTTKVPLYGDLSDDILDMRLTQSETKRAQRKIQNKISQATKIGEMNSSDVKETIDNRNNRISINSNSRFLSKSNPYNDIKNSLDSKKTIDNHNNRISIDSNSRFLSKSNPYNDINNENSRPGTQKSLVNTHQAEAIFNSIAINSLENARGNTQSNINQISRDGQQSRSSRIKYAAPSTFFKPIDLNGEQQMDNFLGNNKNNTSDVLNDKRISTTERHLSLSSRNQYDDSHAD